MRHTYVVTYKAENKGIRMTCFDADYLETVSYDYVTNAWVYNSTDVVNITEDYALKSEIITSYNDLSDKPTIPDAVSGTNDGTNWTSLTIGSNTYDIPQGGGSSETVIEVSSTINTSAATTVTFTAEQVAAYNAAVLAHEPITFVLLVQGGPDAENTRVYLRPGMYVYTGVPSVNGDTAFYGFYYNWIVKLNGMGSGTGIITTASLTFTS